MTYLTSLLSGSVVFLSTLGSPVLAGEKMDAAQLKALISGNTLYVEISAGAPGAPDGGTAPIYYADDGSAVARLPAGLKLIGTWALQGDRYCIDWDNGPKNSCTLLERGAAGFVVIDADVGERRGVVTRIAVGNPEHL